jgi:hypothetical protein
MKNFRQIIEEIIANPVRITLVDVEKEFMHFDKFKGEWKLVMTKSLVEDTDER